MVEAFCPCMISSGNSLGSKLCIAGGAFHRGWIIPGLVMRFSKEVHNTVHCKYTMHALPQSLSGI